MKHLRSYKAKNYSKDNTLSFIEQWDITETIKDCFIEYTDKYNDLNIDYASYTQDSTTGEYVSEQRTTLSQIKRRLEKTIERECGWIISVPTKDSITTDKYHPNILHELHRKEVEKNMIFDKCYLRLSSMIPNYIGYFNGGYEDTGICVYPKKREQSS